MSRQVTWLQNSRCICWDRKRYWMLIVKEPIPNLEAILLSDAALAASTFERSIGRGSVQ